MRSCNDIQKCTSLGRGVSEEGASRNNYGNEGTSSSASDLERYDIVRKLIDSTSHLRISGANTPVDNSEVLNKGLLLSKAAYSIRIYDIPLSVE
jgi:hypothetical protein